MSSFCEGCAYATDKKIGCKAFNKKPEKCWNHTTQKEAKEREKQMREYKIAYAGK